MSLNHLCGLGALLATAAVSSATVNLAPGGATGLSGTTSASEPDLVGSALIADLTTDFQIFGDDLDTILYEGTFQMRVLENLDGDYHFYHRIRETNPDFDGVFSHIELTGYAGWDIAVDYRMDSSGDMGPSRATRSVDGDTVDFLFGNPFFAPDESLFFFATTSANEFTEATATLFLTSGHGVTLTSLAPAVPAPASLALLGAGGLFAARRRRG